MAKNHVSDLRNHLFETLEKLKEGEIEIERAEAICRVSQTIINSAKVEVDHLKVVGDLLGQEVDPKSSFFDGGRPALPETKQEKPM